MNEDGAPANLVDLLGRLIEPPVPDPVSLWPQTAGWWVIGALAATALAYGVWRAWLNWRADAYRRAALADLAAAGDDAVAIATVLRRAALAAYPRRQVASLTGERWVAFLRETGPFPETAVPDLVRAPYAPVRTTGALRKAAEGWVRQHRRAP